MTSTNHTRQAFLEFFGKNDHAVLPSSPLVPKDDPTLMFANAGMNQFKNIFTGAQKAPHPRAATSQKCVRAGGKHNDLDNVGYTARHHTFFEMLGNFSFGDYFKEGAIEFAWKLLTKDLGLNKEKLSFTVYHTDDEAFNLWKKITGCDDGKILRIPTKDNFWAMGDTGPCGPCSEIFYDHGEKAGSGAWALNEDGSDRFDARFVEIWNLVFMQYEQVTPDERINLPKPSIDTGMGLERIAAVMQGKFDNYDIDLFRNLIAASEALTKTKAEGERKAAHRVIADHLRSSCFLIADGVLPSNEGRGYVLRRIMRRAMRYAHQLGCKDPLIYQLVPALVAEMGGAYPELARAQAIITENLKLEEERFKQTLERGLKLLDEETATLAKGGTLGGDVAFKLYDTYGFPLDLTEDILRGRGMKVDNAGFEKAMEGQKEMARAAWSGSGEKAVEGEYFKVKEEVGATKFVGYDTDSAEATVTYVSNGGALKAGEEGFVALNVTPFYGESGGQVGDTGILKKNGETVAQVLNTTKPVEDLHIHKVKARVPIAKGDALTAEIDTAARNRTRANHSATHILHAVLRKQLGEHISQKGSLVASDRLRFDISHPKAVSAEEQQAVEREVNRIIAQRADTSTEEMSPDDAQKKGAMALFGEKYGDRVRVLSMGADEDGKAYSMELCGGTHVKNTGDIGAFKIVSEGSVASGVRRLEAVTGEGVRDYAKEELARLDAQLAALLAEQAALQAGLNKPASSHATVVNVQAVEKAPLAEVVAVLNTQAEKAQAAIAQLQEENKKLSKQLAEQKLQQVLAAANDVKPEMIGSVQFIAKSFDDVAPKDLRPLAENFLKQAPGGVVVVATGFEGKASVVAAVGKPLTDKLSAVELVQAAAAATGGKGGGGRPDMAQAGGPDASKLADAIATMRAIVQQKCA